MAIASPYQLLGTRGVIRAVWSFGFGSLLMSIKHGTLNSVSAGTARTRAPVIPSAACSMSGAAGDSGRSHGSPHSSSLPILGAGPNPENQTARITPRSEERVERRYGRY